MESEDASMPRWTDDDITQMQWKMSEDYPLEPPVPAVRRWLSDSAETVTWLHILKALPSIMQRQLGDVRKKSMQISCPPRRLPTWSANGWRSMTFRLRMT